MQTSFSSPSARTTRRLAVAAGLTAALLWAAVPAHAQDKATLDLLVKKGVITQDEADAVAKQAAVVVTPKEAAVKKLQLEGLLQVQFDWLTTKDKAAHAIEPPATSQFYIRRAYLGAIADLGNGWGGEILLDFAAGAKPPAAPQSTTNAGTQNSFEKAIITKKIDDYGLATAGFQKVQWDQEENTPSSQLLTIERSVATRYFDEAWGGSTTGRLGFGNRHTGLFWNGVVPGFDGFYYGVGLTNGIQSDLNYGNSANGVAAYNEFGGWVNLGYSGTYTPIGLYYKVGINAGYAGEANSVSGLAKIDGYNQNNAISGYNPYFTVSYAGFSLAGEFLQAFVQNGRQSGAGAAAVYSKAAPYGFNLTPSYKINSQWELAAKYSYLSTNGRGTAINPVDPNAQNTLNVAVPVGATAVQNFDNVNEFYAGVNYYIIGYDLKLSAGYEFDQYTGRQTFLGGSFNGARANVNGVRTQLQLLF
ncbi:MAG: porin [Opitutales bacterium]